MKYLDDELIIKYFSCHDPEDSEYCLGDFAQSVLKAMSEPIREGDRYLSATKNFDRINWVELINRDPALVIDDWHPYALRLPERLQSQHCPTCGHVKLHPDALRYPK